MVVCVVAFCVDEKFKVKVSDEFFITITLGIGASGDDVVYRMFCFLSSKFVRR